MRIRLSILTVLVVLPLLIVALLFASRPSLSAAGEGETAVAVTTNEPAFAATQGLTPTQFLPTFFAPPDGPCYWTQDNEIIIIEVEMVPPVELWQLETDKPGYTGWGYYTWRGPEYFGAGGVGVLTYPIQVLDGGRFNTRIRNLHDHPDSTLENDVWIRLDNGPWIKAFSSDGTGQWNWEMAFEPSHGVFWTAAYDISPGLHTLQLSARSRNFRLDRIALWKDGGPDGRDLFHPPSPCLFP